jgi:uncharacterized protein YjiS (DUF1127 family)
MSNYVNIFKEEIIPGYISLGNGSEKRFGIGRIGSAISLWRQRSSQRSALEGLDARLLDDIGLNRKQAVEEASKPFWQD